MRRVVCGAAGRVLEPHGDGALIMLLHAVDTARRPPSCVFQQRVCTAPVRCGVLQDVIDSTARVAMRSVQEMEQTVVPAIERGYRWVLGSCLSEHAE